MEDPAFPSNRNRKEPEQKKVEKVVTGNVERRKPPMSRRFREMFVGGDAKNVSNFVFLEILLPAVKDTIADMVSQGIERMLFGDARSTSRRTGARPGGGYVSYNRYSSPSPWNRDRERREERPARPRPRGSHDFDDIILATRAEATEVIDRMFDLISKYDQATVSDLLELVGLEGKFTDERWGWTDFRGAIPRRVNDGYLLDLPKPEPLD